MAIRAIVFDAYGTLFDVHSVVPRCEALFPGRGRLLSETWRQKQLEYAWLRSLIGRYEGFERLTATALQSACASLGLVLSESGREALLQNYRRLKLYPEATDALAGLRDCHLGLLSNGSAQMLSELVGEAGLARTFDQLISVDDARVYKPHPAAYRLAVERTPARLDEIAFVSSNYWDACGAAAFGFRTFWIDRSKSPPEDLGAKPAAVLERLTDLIGLIDD